MNRKIFTLLFLGFCATMPLAQAQTEWEVGPNTTLTEYDLVTGVNLPWEILWGQDDYIWATLRTGKVLRIDPATGNYTEVLSITVTGDGSSEPGLLGMALHPDFPNTPTVYLVYNSGSVWSGEERLSAWEWNGTELVNETILVDEIVAGGIHNGSRIIITPDNKILMTTGDTGDGGVSSQNINALNGKTLRINLDGSIPDDNPDPTSYVYSFGHRNSQGLCNGPNGIIYASEHGQSNSDEFNIIEANRNYGWPNVEGACNTASEQTFCEANNVREPLKEWSPCVAVNGIEYYNHPAIPEWENSVLMSVLGGLGGQYERLSILHMSDDGMEVDSEQQFFSSFNQRIRDICVNPYDGSIYVAFNGTSYPGSGPNIIKHFVNEDFTAVKSPAAHSNQNIEVYPNPVEGRATIEFSPEFIGTNYMIYSFTGQLIRNEILDGSAVQINGDDLAPGQYYVKSTTQYGTVTRTFIVK
ncbi:MAG: PQQ-dependent sugar dehydrogenase [Flavobacteriales bacterium]|nr:PQQ-dependent sugar dehydrogenase [Flavobacteriales bacterium]